MEDKKYFSRSWALMTKEKGWIKPILLMALACFVPIVGALGVLGYACEWARLSAWGVDSSPKQKGVKVGACIASGWRAFVVILAWSLVVGILGGIVNAILSFLLRGLGSTLVTIAEFVLAAPIMVAALHACVYEKIGAGFKVSRFVEMIKRDPSGLFKTLLIPLAEWGIVAAASTLVFSVMIGFALPDIMRLVYEAQYYGDSYTMASIIASILRGVLPGTILFLYATLVVSSAASLLFVNSIGLWMSQFDVRSWGGPDEPLPAQANTLPPAPVTPVEPAPAPEPAVAPAPAPAPESVPAPVSTPAPEPASAVTPEPVSVPEPPAEPAPAEASAPAATPEPAPASEAAAAPASTPQEEASKPVSVPAPDSEEAERLQNDKGETIVPLVKLPHDNEEDQQ